VNTGCAKARIEHPHAWLWEPLEGDPGFVLSPMFGGKSVYLDGRLSLFFIAKANPWCGLLVCTDRDRQPLLVEEFPGLVPHPVLPKWLYLAESQSGFEGAAARLVALARARDPRIGVTAKERKHRAAAPRRKKT